MTVKEFWQLKYGTVVEYVSGISGWGWKGKVIKREVIEESTGFIISKSKTYDITTGRKILEITFDCGNGEMRYMQSNKDLRRLQVVG